MCFLSIFEMFLAFCSVDLIVTIMKHIFLWCLFISLNYAQDCGTPGQPCSDDKQCCGGCCIDGTCISTYKNCEEVYYPCIEDYCGPGFECYMYNPPPECVGCGLQRACRPYKDPGSGHF